MAGYTTERGRVVCCEGAGDGSAPTSPNGPSTLASSAVERDTQSWLTYMEDCNWYPVTLWVPQASHP